MGRAAPGQAGGLHVALVLVEIEHHRIPVEADIFEEIARAGVDVLHEIGVAQANGLTATRRTIECRVGGAQRYPPPTVQ